MMKITFVDSSDAIAPELWEACFQAPREGVWWYRALERCGIEEQFTFLYGVIEADGRQVGIAPCFITDVPLELVVPEATMKLLAIPGKLFPSLLVQRTFFVGSPCSDEGWIGVLPGIDRRAALLAVQDAVSAEARRRRIRMLVWKDFPAEVRAEMAWLAGERRLFALPSYPNALASFPSDRKEDYFASLKGSRRHQLKKKLRQSAERVEVDVSVIQAPSPTVLDEVWDLFQQTFEQSDVQFERLNRRFFDLVAAEPQAHFILLRERASQKLITFMMCFEVGDLVINKFIGFDYSRPKEWLLYFRLWEAALDWALARGARAIQSGQTCYQPKIEQGHDLMPLFNYGRHTIPLMHRIYTKVAQGITWSTLDDGLARYVQAHPEAADGSLP
ncbi:MAG TPA: GNAT family N-acetyltransferase [Magnetospirillum sp.]|jgi:hypothetical protein|nr:GNAT family N-acetyltransferase [Magnetospirillum sp.]